MTQETKEQGCQLLLESHDGYNNKKKKEINAHKCLKFTRNSYKDFMCTVK